MNRIRKSSEPGVDDLDLLLVKELELDARQSNPSLAKKLGTSSTTIHRRVQRLIDAGTITIAARPEPLVLGFSTRALMGITVRPGKSDAVAGYLAPYRCVRAIRLIAGRYDALLTLFFRSQEELLGFISEELGKIPDLMDAETMAVLKVVKSSWMYLRGDTGATREATPRPLDELEVKLIEALESSPRESITHLSKKLQINRTLMGKKMQVLLNENIVRVVSVADPTAFGFGTQAIILVKTRPGQINAATDHLVADRRVNRVVITTGRFDLFLSANFQDSTEMADFLKNILGVTPGIVHYETMLQLAVPKQSFSLLT
ncbi:MAG: Lrp/AsnC family transcriptional regulator [Dehalococcoidia bacterium]|nr:Lrp/AsnC family transcriptional regulator [Dehalococcoidia bacterium]